MGGMEDSLGGGRKGRLRQVVCCRGGDETGDGVRRMKGIDLQLANLLLWLGQPVGSQQMPSGLGS